MATISSDLLRRDVRTLGDMLGEVITESAGSEALALIETIRQLSRRRRSGDHVAEAELAERIPQLTIPEARVVARAFSVFFDLANLAEDRHRIRVLRARVQETAPNPISETIAAGIAKLREAGFTADQVQAAINAVKIELVFTAHPSEAKRRSIRAKLRRMRHALQERDRPDLLPRECERLEMQIRADLTVLWQTDFLRPSKPTVLEEVERGLSITPRLVEVVPQVYDSLRRALEMYYPGKKFDIPLFLRFGSWMGGDRDGNPHVTAAVSRQTLLWLRESAIAQHLAMCKKMYDFLSLSTHEIPVESVIVQRLAERSATWPELAKSLEPVTPLEVYRRWVCMIQWRLQKSMPVDAGASIPIGGYRDGADLFADLQVIQDSLTVHHSQLLAETEVQRWLDLARVFGLHLTRLDVRQDARRYREIMTDILSTLGIVEGYGDLPEEKRCEVLSKSLPWTKPIATDKLAPLTLDTLELFRLLHEAVRSFGPDCLGGHVISLTQCPSDVLNVLWLWRWAQATATETIDDELRIIPLFEKIEDLKNASQTLDAILSHPLYREHVSRLQNRQVIMVGYSDSTKDGGYLAACWGLYQAQSQLQAVAEKHDVSLTFFHGRGGSLGRGGGPAARGILSLPPEALDGTLRLTEQGEVLAERYDDTQVAFRHLEQVAWATLTASALPGVEVKPAWRDMIDELSKRSYTAYRELVDQPGFIQFFASATPIDEIENLPIGSRPARRRGERSLGDLRAIPWVFSWTQNRCMIPAWYGLGTALAEVKYRDRTSWNTICEMYRAWPFMQATIDNAVLALAKADMYIAHHYADLEEDSDIRQRCWSLIAAERDRTRQALLDMVGGGELLATNPWFYSSIDARNPYIDPLNLIQVDLLRRRRTLPAEATDAEREQLRDMLRLTVQGIAAGMRTTG
ncbi:Phosphoenolpyruvate carboxylase [Anatilimnocola aggregata]|uniref:Phosphoenolpyruvate carboxylase n=1 Tax=Anatilimnocola aggregata TaxID=2528021 RepID=A0A517YCH9_9BACT|nr:phosphoenolpyruvate carboxylase [Anatilimnocola aggregata]QDU27832.1 Phosphoenolpyruvate carboxylase [Anatilimnocola aggregata]